MPSSKRSGVSIEPNYYAPVCVCGCIRFEAHFTSFPMRQWFTCRRCGTEHPRTVELKQSKPKPVVREVRQVFYDDYGNPYYG